MAKRSRAELEAENEFLRAQVDRLSEALVNALRGGHPPVPYVPATGTGIFPWQQPGGGILLGDPPPGTGPQTWWVTTPPSVSVSLYQSVGGFPPPEATEFYVGDVSEQHDQP